MKRFVFLVVLALLMLPFWGCGRTVPPGHVGIVVNSFGTDKGVQNMPVKTGWVGYNPFTETVLVYPTYVQTAVWTHTMHEGKNANEEISFSTKGSAQFTADISFSYSLAPERVPSFYEKFRSDDLNAFTHGFLRNVVRDAFNETGVTYDPDQILGDKQTDMLKSVTTKVNETIVPIEIGWPLASHQPPNQ